MEKEQPLETRGHIGYSLKRKNSVVSNVWGAAAFNSQLDLLRSLYSIYSGGLPLELRTEERRGLASSGTFQKELTGATPLMLAVAAGDHNKEVVQWMIEEAECNTDVKDWQENTLLHLAVRYNCREITSYLVCANIVDPFQRNAEGESAPSMAQALSHSEISNILSSCKDNSGQKVIGRSRISWG